MKSEDMAARINALSQQWQNLYEGAIRERDEARAAAARFDREASQERAINMQLRSQIERLRTALQEEEHDHSVTIDQRDRAQEMADKLAWALAGDRCIGEHSSMNDPWQNSLDLPDPVVIPLLPDVGAVTREGHLLRCDGDAVEDGDATTDEHRKNAAVWLRHAAKRFAFADFLDAEAADASPDKKCLCDYPAGSACGAEPQSVYWCPQHGPDEDEQAADTAPDTSRVTFGTRHEGTGMVLLQHADSTVDWWGEMSRDTAIWHRACADRNNGELSALHAALAEVREALDDSEAAGVDVNDRNRAYSEGFFPDADLSTLPAYCRARRFLAREVQALVDQGLRGDELNARVHFAVRDHRAQVKDADTSSEDKTPTDAEVESLASVLCDADDTNDYRFDGAGIHLRCTYRDMARAAIAHRAARVEGGA